MNVRAHWVQDGVTITVRGGDTTVAADMSMEQAWAFYEELGLQIKIATSPPIPSLEGLIENVRSVA